MTSLLERSGWRIVDCKAQKGAGAGQMGLLLLAEQ
jgi:hypothetical protein